MDKECVLICDAINNISGLYTTESCCGHGRSEFNVHFNILNQKYLPVLLYYSHVGFEWTCEVYTDCAMSIPTYCLKSQSMGESAYSEANIIASKIEKYLLR